MTPSFNLVDAAWVPCVTQDGTVQEFGLYEALTRAHELQGLHGESPLVEAALYRLLLAILHRKFGPAGYEAWQALWLRGHWDESSLLDYFDHWRGRFDLFDAERPFYQAPDDRVKPKSLLSLVPHQASGNNPTLFDHSQESRGLELSPAESARALVTAQAFGLGGLSGLPQKFTDGTCARGIIFLVQGTNLFETLALNLIRYPDPGLFPSEGQDLPAWEMDDPYLPGRQQPLGYLDYLTWQNRRVLLRPLVGADQQISVREMTVAPALRLASGLRDPMKHYRLDEKRGPRRLDFHEERALWRDSAALFRLRGREAQGGSLYQPPQALSWLYELPEDGSLTDADQASVRRLRALGMASYQGRVDFYQSEELPLREVYLRDEALVEQLRLALDLAENTRNQLWGALSRLAALTISPEADREGGRQPAKGDVAKLITQWGGERDYWGRLGVPFFSTLDALADPDRQDAAWTAWVQTLSRAAWQVLDRMIDQLGDDAAALKASVLARGQMAAGLGKVLKDHQEVSE